MSACKTCAHRRIVELGQPDAPRYVGVCMVFGDREPRDACPRW